MVLIYIATLIFHGRIYVQTEIITPYRSFEFRSTYTNMPIEKAILMELTKRIPENVSHSSQITIYTGRHGLTTDWDDVSVNRYDNVQNPRQWKDLRIVFNSYKYRPEFKTKGIYSGSMQSKLNEYIEERIKRNYDYKQNNNKASGT